MKMPENQNPAEGGNVAAQNTPAPSQQVNGNLTPEQIASIVEGVVRKQMEPIASSLAETNKRISSVKKSTRAELAKVRQQRKAVVPDPDDFDDGEDDGNFEERREAPSWMETRAETNNVMAVVSKDTVCGHMLRDPLLARQVEGAVENAIARGYSAEDASKMAMGILYPQAMAFAEATKPSPVQPVTPPANAIPVPGAEQNPAIPSTASGGAKPITGDGLVDPIPQDIRDYQTNMGIKVPTRTK